MRIVFFTALVAVLLLFMSAGCDEDTETVVVTDNYYCCSYGVYNPDGILGYTCFNIDNTDGFGPHYGSIAVGTLEVMPAWGNSMDVAIISFDLTEYPLPANAAVFSAELVLNLPQPSLYTMNVYVTTPGVPGTNGHEVMSAVIDAPVVGQTAVYENGSYTISLDNSGLVTYGGMLYLGMYSDADYVDSNSAEFDKDLSYIRVTYYMRED